MEVKLLIGAHAYAHIQYAGGSMDVLLDAGHSPEFSLSRTASELQDKAKAIIRRAEIIQQAAAYLEAQKAKLTDNHTHLLMDKQSTTPP